MASNSVQSVLGNLTLNRLLIVLASLALGAVLVSLLLVGGYESGKTLAREVFPLPQDATSDWLSEKAALDCGSRLLDRIFPSASWKPVEDNRSVAPDGSKDQFLVRNTINPAAEGSILYTDVTPSGDIPSHVVVRFTLRERTVTCVLSRTK